MTDTEYILNLLSSHLLSDNINKYKSKKSNMKEGLQSTKTEKVKDKVLDG